MIMIARRQVYGAAVKDRSMEDGAVKLSKKGRRRNLITVVSLWTVRWNENLYLYFCICYTCTQVFYSYTEGATWKILELLTETLLI